MSKRILLVGEPMGLFIANSVGELERVSDYTLATCGAELNVAIGLSRLGQQVTYLTKLGNDPFGKRIVNSIKENNISTEAVLFSDTNQTGFMFKSKVTQGDPSIFYFRKGSAASTLSAKDINCLDFTSFDLVHLTGITPALTPSTREACEALNQNARRAGCLFSFDPNLRPQLWPSEAEMVGYINRMATQSDLFLPGIGEAKTLLGETSPERIARYYLERGTGVVVVKLGCEGAYFASNSGESGYVNGFQVDTVVDTVGAGDGFAAGVLSALREKCSLREAVRRGCAVGAIQVMSAGDNDGLPTLQELDAFVSGSKDWRLRGA